MRNSICQDLISRKTHVDWCKAKIIDASCFFYIVSFESGEPFGQVRFDVEKGDATISIGLGSAFRGQGLGSEVLARAVTCLFEKSKVSRVHAFVKASNCASVRMFEGAGFCRNTGEPCDSQDRIHFVFHNTSGN
jgi:RimJ/RimL family protein N-acetyltransferase